MSICRERERKTIGETETCLRYAWDMPGFAKTNLEFAWDMLEICLRNVWYMPNLLLLKV